MFRVLLALIGATTMTFANSLDPIFQKVQPKDGPYSGWRYTVSPPIPAQWPPTSNSSTVVFYAWASAFDPQLRDGERSSAPFAKVDLSPDGGVKVTQLTDTLEQVDIQGVRPISKGQASLQAVDMVEAARTGQMSSLRAPFCAWRNNHGAVCQHLERLHPAFFGALQCDSVKGGGSGSK